MIVVHVEYRYPPEADAAMRALVPAVEQFARGFDGCESFALSFPVDRPGILLGAEVWTDAAALNAHIAVAHDAAELEPWHQLLARMEATLFSGTPLTHAQLREDGAKR